jgi:23S rRNA pseudouridine2605 synthase
VSETEGVRLQKVLSQAGVASRRASEDLITAGRVKVNGKTVTVLGTRVDPIADAIEVDGERISVSAERVVIAMNKPKGIVTTSDDELGRPTVIEMLPQVPGLRAVGRLDMDTTGLLLATTDGDLAHRLTHPRWAVERVYLAEVEGVPDKDALRAMRSGVELEDGPAKVKRVTLVDHQPGRAHLELVLTEGRNREVRRLLEAVGHPVRHLGRTRYGPIRLGDLPTGKSRYLNPAEIGSLLRSVDL